jgi:V/A-type H+/Na+-transporting ATPase subunit E
MRSIEENIETLSRAILDVANADAEQILSDAHAKADSIRQRAHDQAAAERKEILDRAYQEAQRIRSQSVATAQLKARTMTLEHREKLLNSVFANARKDVGNIEKWSDYEAIARHLLKEAIQQLGASSVRVHADAITQKTLTGKPVDDISQELKVSIEFGDALAKGTGVVVETTDGHLQYENTLENRLNRLQNVLRSPVYHILIGETL